MFIFKIRAIVPVAAVLVLVAAVFFSSPIAAQSFAGASDDDSSVRVAHRAFDVLNATDPPLTIDPVTPAPINATATPKPRARAKMTWEAWVSLFTTIAVLLVLGLELATTTGVMVTATTFLGLCGIISPQQVFAGLSNNGVVSIGVLFMLVEPITGLAGIRRLFEKLLSGGSKHTFIPCFKIGIFCLILSAFTNNTPLVALLTPLIKNFCRNNGLAPSQILMSMSFATLIGGTLSLIGTSTNLIFDGLMRDAGMGALGFFDTATVGGIPAILYLLYLTFMPAVLLSNDQGGMFKLIKERGREFFAELRVLDVSTLVGASVAEVRDQLPESEGVRLIEIVRRGVSIFPLEDTQTIEQDDRLVFSGEVAVLQKHAVRFGLVFVTDEEVFDDVAEGQEAVTRARAGSRSPALGVSRQSRHTPSLGTTPVNPDTTSLGRSPKPRRSSSALSSHNTPAGAADASTAAANPAAARLDAQLSVHPDITVSDGGDAASTDPYADGGERPAQQQQQQQQTADDTADPTAQQQASAPLAQTTFFEAVVAPQNPSIGQLVSSRHLQLHFRCAILACRTRAGKDLTGVALRRHRLEQGDTLLLLAAENFTTTFRLGQDFYVASKAGLDFEEHATDHYFVLPSWMPIGQLIQPGTSKTPDEGTAYRAIAKPWWYNYFVLPIFLGVIISVVGFEQNISLAALVGVVAMVILRIRTPEQVVARLNFDLLLMIAFSFGLGSSMNSSGLAKVIGQLVIDANLSGFPQLLVIALATCVITNVVISQAAAQVLFPIVFEMYSLRGEDPKPAVLMMICCTSYAFFTHYGANTSLIVMGPGNYKFLDFLKFGGLLNILTTITMALSTSITYNVW